MSPHKTRDGKYLSADTAIISATSRWIDSVVVGYQFCPFAARELKRNSIHYHVSHRARLEDDLADVIDECRRLDNSDTIETTLLIYPDNFEEFEAFLDFFALAEHLMVAQGYEGIYQLASFHPHYCFADSAMDDPANYTNRSPYPMLHLLRESSLEAALKNYDQPESIPENNIHKATHLGLEKLRSVLQSCYQSKK